MAGAPFTIKLWIYPGANPAASPSTWGLAQDISAYVRQPGQDGGQVISYTGGRQDEAAQVDAGTLSLSLDNRGGQFSTHNALGPWAGLLDTNTPYRFGMTSGLDTFTRTAGSLGTSDSGQLWVANTGSFSTTGAGAQLSFASAGVSGTAHLTDSGAADYDLVFTTWCSVVTTGDSQIGAGIQWTTGSDVLLFRLDFQPAGALICQIHRIGGAGTAILATSAALPTTYTAGQRYRVRCQRDGFEVRMKAWPEASTEPATWNLTTTENSLAPGDMGIFAWRLAGNTNAGATFQGFDTFESTAIEQSGTVVQWPVRWDKSGNNSWAPISGAGILRRLQQGKGARKSPLTRQLAAYSPTGFWPLEDAAGSAGFAALVKGTQPGIYSGVTLAADSTLPGSTTSPVLAVDTGFIRVVSTKLHRSDGFSAMFFTKMSAVPTAKTAFCQLSTSGLAKRWVMSIDATATYVEAFDADDNLLSSAVNLFSPQVPTDWIAWQLETSVTGGTTTSWLFLSHSIGEVTYYTQSGSHSGSGSAQVSQVQSMVIGSKNLSGMAVANLWLGPNTLPFVTDSFSRVSDGYRGELASDRITRVCAEEGILVTVEPGVSDPCGPQQESTALDVLRAAEAADQGILYERGTGLGYRPRSVRYRQSVLMALTVAAGQIDDPPEPIMDDQRRANSVTASRVGGSSATVTDDANVAKIGAYPGPSLNLNVASDDVLPWHAGWRVYLGTRRDLRWPGLSLDFARNPTLLPAWRKRGYGPRIQVTTGRPQVLGSDPDVIVEGFAVQLHPFGMNVALAASSAQGWDVYTLDDDLVRLDADNSKLDLAVTTTVATTIQVDNNGDAGNTWAPTSLLPAEVPFYIRVDQEVMTVTNVGDVFSSTKQILTVTRGTNAAANTHVAGAQVSLAYPMIIAL